VPQKFLSLKKANAVSFPKDKYCTVMGESRFGPSQTMDIRQ